MAAVTVTVTKNSFDEVEDATRKAIGAALDSIAQKVQRDIKVEIRKQGLIRTGNYQNSWVTERDSENTRSVRSKGAMYGAYLEYGHRANPGQVFPLREGNTVVGFRRVRAGTTWVPARPHVRPVAYRWAKKVRGEYERLLSQAYARVLKS